MISTRTQVQSDGAQVRPVILIVEDNSDLQEVLHTQLKFYGFEPVCVDDGASALKWLARHQADLIILDLMLPGIDGVRLCKRIRKKYSLNSLPILMLSALGSQTYARIRGLKAGANDFLAKPYNLDELVARIQILLRSNLENERMAEALSRYVAPAVREQAQFDPDLLMRRQARNAVVMFADLRGFTQLSTHTDLVSLTTMLDQFFTEMMAVVDRHHGHVFDITGDELLVAFNIPYDLSDSSQAAVNAAIEMQTLFNQLLQEWAYPPGSVGLGIGIHQGEVMLGNVGGKELVTYTIIGSVVNIAHRLVDLAHSGEIVLSAELYEQASSLLKGFDITKLSPVTLKGISEPQPVVKVKIPAPQSQGPVKESDAGPILYASTGR